jgi:hypothetical protein
MGIRTAMLKIRRGLLPVSKASVIDVFFEVSVLK